MRNASELIDIKNLTLPEITKILIENGEKAFRAAQLYHEVYTNRRNSFEEMSTLSKDLRKKLAEIFSLDTFKSTKKRTSSDGSVKFLFELHDGNAIETVYMPWFDEDKKNVERITICISSMAGCPVKCSFCASGSLGLQRSLTTAEVIDQIMCVEKEMNCTIKNIVIMGMGEPLLNYENITRAINIMTDPESKMVSRRRITLSTSGIIAGIRRLRYEKNAPKLALSLHATTDKMRGELIPISQHYKLESLLKEIDLYYRNTKMGITYEYILFDGLNDSDDDVKRLARIARRVPSRINIIPFNDVSFAMPDNTLKPASRDQINNFVHKLKKAGVTVLVRDSFGQDIEAACGQLALSENEKQEKI